MADFVSSKRTLSILFRYTTVTLDKGESHYILSINSETRCLLDSKYTLGWKNFISNFEYLLYLLQLVPHHSMAAYRNASACRIAINANLYHHLF